MRRIIREEEPPRPSLRLSTLGQSAATTVSARRQSDPRRLSQFFRGELDWIVMKALEKNRTPPLRDGQRFRGRSCRATCATRRWPPARLRPAIACEVARRNQTVLPTVAVVALGLLLAAGRHLGWAPWDQAAQQTIRRGGTGRAPGGDRTNGQPGVGQSPAVARPGYRNASDEGSGGGSGFVGVATGRSSTERGGSRPKCRERRTTCSVSA